MHSCILKIILMKKAKYSIEENEEMKWHKRVHQPVIDELECIFIKKIHTQLWKAKTKKKLRSGRCNFLEIRHLWDAPWHDKLSIKK